MDLNKCEMFVRAIDTGSFSRAAEQSGYTPSGVAHMMDALEDEIGFPLLVRGHRGVRATENGQKLLPILRELLHWNEQFKQTAAEINGLETGTVRIGSYSSIATHWLPKVIKAFRENYPHIEIHLMEGIRQEVDRWLAERRVDLGFFSYQEPMSYEWIPLKTDPMLAVLPPDHPMAQLSAYPLVACRDEAFIMPALGKDADVVELLEKAGLTPQIRFSTLENYATLSMIECGLGMSIMNELITKGRQNHVVMLPLDPPHSITLGIAVPSIKTASPSVRKFISYATRMLKE
ncbi:LysR family transcriptional regulator [Acetonema longum]|uniref:HTH lysR-type domain-containing protein n=1 Tax=Acetonema longum DSM 6540 TaxID=1009370 RepID=F7NN29_9FIRM|nr:LysR family transcriptional regulator [Acetonema longum]EGO62563.1 hypothetical protein ALO_17561 [Acetonema longum DSM 6540]